jgi:hypothetical protein
MHAFHEASAPVYALLPLTVMALQVFLSFTIQQNNHSHRDAASSNFLIKFFMPCSIALPFDQTEEAMTV